jgi:hypothetical protein
MLGTTTLSKDSLLKLFHWSVLGEGREKWIERIKVIKFRKGLELRKRGVENKEAGRVGAVRWVADPVLGQGWHLESRNLIEFVFRLKKRLKKSVPRR